MKKHTKMFLAIVLLISCYLLYRNWKSRKVLTENGGIVNMLISKSDTQYVIITKEKIVLYEMEQLEFFIPKTLSILKPLFLEFQVTI